MLHRTVIAYGEGLIAHGQRACPDGYGRVHPTIIRQTWRTWQWHAGRLVDAWIDVAHRLPVIRRLVCAVWCTHYVRYRGPWAPLASEVFPIPWERSLHPERQNRYDRPLSARMESKTPESSALNVIPKRAN
jgi:hypothetical protein